MHKKLHRMIFRAHGRPLTALPLGVRSAGHFSVDEGWIEKPRKKWFTQLFWTVRGTGEFFRGGQGHVCGPGDIFIYQPGDVHDLCSQGRWVYRWLTFDHSEAARWLRDLGLGEGVHAAGPCPERLFNDLERALEDCTTEGERAASRLAYALLLAAASATSKVEISPPAIRARELLDRRFANPAWGIANLATEMGLHRSTLLRLFRTAYELSPADYLQNLRIRRALTLLRESPLQIQEVAWRSGFADPNYFARAIRQRTGMSPKELRAR
jgi:AraC-like DNA-binding protein